MTCVVDASVAVKWLIEEEGSAAAAALEAEDLHAPGLIRLEVGNALRTLAARKLLAPAAAEKAFALFLTGGVRMHEPDPPLLADTLRLALSINHPIYDCVYLALAERLGCPLVTADRRFAMAASSAGITLIRMLG